MMSSPTRLEAGVVVWAKVDKRGWWPGIIIDREHLGKIKVGGRQAAFPVYWFGDGRVSSVPKTKIKEFTGGYMEYFKNQKRGFDSPIYQGITEYRKMMYGLDESWDAHQAREWANGGFNPPADRTVVRRSGISNYVKDRLEKVQPSEDEDSSDGERSTSSDGEEDDCDAKEEECEKEQDHLRDVKISTAEATLRDRILSGEIRREDVCICCFSHLTTDLKDHPIFAGKICDACEVKFRERKFALGFDGVSFCCVMCLQRGQLIVCSKRECSSAFCTKCIELKDKAGALQAIWDADTWDCYLCSVRHKFNPSRKYSPSFGFFKTLPDWKRKVLKLFHPLQLVDLPPLRLLCLDDSSEIACAVLPRLLKFYFQIEEVLLCSYTANASQALQKTAPVLKYRDIPACRKQLAVTRTNLFSFIRILQKIKSLNLPLQKDSPLLFVLEAFPSSQAENTRKKLVTRYLECEPGLLDGKLVWTNIPTLWFDLRGNGFVSPRLQEMRSRRGSRKKMKRR